MLLPLWLTTSLASVKVKYIKALLELCNLIPVTFTILASIASEKYNTNCPLIISKLYPFSIGVDVSKVTVLVSTALCTGTSVLPARSEMAAVVKLTYVLLELVAKSMLLLILSKSS